MKVFIQALLVPLLVFSSVALSWADAVDIRAVYHSVEQQNEESAKLKVETERSIKLQKADLDVVLKTEKRNKLALERQLKLKQTELESRRNELKKLKKEQQQDHEMMTNLSAAVRVSAKQLQELVTRSPLTAADPQRPERLDKILSADHFPGLDDMQLMADMFFSEMERSAKVTYEELPFRNREGHFANSAVLQIGPFLAVKADPQGLELLRFDSDNLTFSSIAASYPWRLKRALKAYLEGDSDSVPIDLSAGAALEQLTRRKNIKQRIKEGGVLVWPILFLAVAAILIGLERMIFLKRVHDNADRTMTEVNRYAGEDDWDACNELVKGRHSPVYNVVRTGLQARHESREMLESVLQEAILKELPRLERALPLLNIMGAVAPLLGLLGTVTGMIGTFEVINIYGTGDPRMMSGGISVALVTTMLGLAVAIPIMLLHTFLSRQVEHIIGDMEEKSVALINIIHRYRSRRPCGKAA